MTNTAADYIAQAADHIERVGLTKGRFFETYSDVENARCCTLGALKVVTGVTSGRIGSGHRFDNAVAALESKLGNVPDWNDKDSQRKGRVVARLRTVAESLAGEQEAA